MTTTWTTDELRETIEDLAYQFAYRSTKDGVPVFITGGLSALEGAFAVLEWDDPYPAASEACEYPGCSEWASCGRPTTDGYKRCCFAHFQEYRRELQSAEGASV